MGFNVPCGHAFGIHRKNLFLDVLADAGLVFLQELRIKFSLSVTGYSYLHIPEAGAQRFAAVSVSAVLRVFVLVVILAVAEFVIQFCIQPILHEFRYGLLEEILDVLHAADVAFLQEFPDFCSPGLLFRTAVLSAAHE